MFDDIAMQMTVLALIGVALLIYFIVMTVIFVILYCKSETELKKYKRARDRKGRFV